MLGSCQGFTVRFRVLLELLVHPSLIRPFDFDYLQFRTRTGRFLQQPPEFQMANQLDVTRKSLLTCHGCEGARLSEELFEKPFAVK